MFFIGKGQKIMYNKEKGKERCTVVTELTARLTGATRKKWECLLETAGLTPEELPEQTALVWDGDTLAATGSRQRNLLKYLAVDPEYRGSDLTATVLSALKTDAFANGYDRLFLYTKPENKWMFTSLFFYSVAATDRVLLMEDRRGGFREYLESLPEEAPQGIIGAAVMNCNPFTKGHRYLIETAAKECRKLYVFVLSEDASRFSAKDRMEMVKLGTADLPNVTVLPTGPYMVSAATFPTYFLKNREQAQQVQCDLDVAIFGSHIAPRLGITRRYVGTEPLSPATAQYNEALKSQLPQKGIEVRELPRLETEGQVISASAVRQRLDAGEDIRDLVPETTYHYLIQGGNNHG